MNWTLIDSHLERAIKTPSKEMDMESFAPGKRDKVKAQVKKLQRREKLKFNLQVFSSHLR